MERSVEDVISSELARFIALPANEQVRISIGNQVQLILRDQLTPMRQVFKDLAVKEIAPSTYRISWVWANMFPLPCKEEDFHEEVMTVVH
jgi:hypothetical protein